MIGRSTATSSSSEPSGGTSFRHDHDVTATRRSIREELGPGYELFIVALSVLSLANVAIFVLPFDPEA